VYVCHVLYAQDDEVYTLVLIKSTSALSHLMGGLSSIKALSLFDIFLNFHFHQLIKNYASKNHETEEVPNFRIPSSSVGDFASFACLSFDTAASLTRNGLRWLAMVTFE
jgi:hypothetical protein